LRNVAGFALTWASAFIALVAIMVNAPALFYMGTGLIAMIAASRLQAWLAVRGLRFDRVAPDSARVGELVTVEITVWSEKKIRRPLIAISDHLPARLLTDIVSPSLPVAPSYDQPVRTQYQFRAQRRGRYKWSGLSVTGTDALGLVTGTRDYETTPAEITVLPRPLPVHVELPIAAGWGISEAESGHTRGAGLEPWGIRGYVPGDPLRHVHWRSTARTGQLLVKEFEAGTHAAAAFLLQTTAGSDLGPPSRSSLDIMCGHAVFLAETFLRQGARVDFPGLDDTASHGSFSERLSEVYESLAGITADSDLSLGEQLLLAATRLPPGSILFVMCCVAEPDLPQAIGSIGGKGISVVPLLYDAASFDPSRAAQAATHPEYVYQIRRAGSSPVVMPSEGQ
jgi:uncharacterized protein (DUF58 family)